MGEFLIIFLSYIDFLSINNSGISIEKLQTNGYMNLKDGKMFKIYISRIENWGDVFGKKYRQRVKTRSWKIYKIINIKIRLTDKIKIFSRN